jgi:acyl-CoA hydrolase
VNFEEMYKEKLQSAAKVAENLQNDWLIGTDANASQPDGLLNAFSEQARKANLHGIKVFTLNDVYPYAFYSDPELARQMTGMSWFSGKGARKAINGGFADYIPVNYSDTPSHIRREYSYDAVCIAVSPMDKHGYFSCGTASSLMEAYLEKSKNVYVEVNRFVPRAVRGYQIHVSEVDAIIENNHELPVLPPSELDETSKTIGGFIAELIPDGACIQLGIGAIPDAVGMALKTKHDLGIHTEMFTDSMVELIECGAVNNSRKQIHRGTSVTTFAYGSQRIYDYIDDNPAIELLPVDYVNNPYVISQLDNFMSINAAVEVDFYGQVCAESIGRKHISGTGGQLDFVRGATHSKGGKSFIAFTSTAKNGTISKIRPVLTSGACVSTGKNDVDYIVTEYGVAHLRGRSYADRVRQLISIAHPNFRDELKFDAKQHGILI